MNRRNTFIAGLAGITTVASITPKAVAEDPQAENPALEVIRAVFKAHDDAMTKHDVEGVLATMAPNAVIMGTGPDEIWSGAEEIKEAYRHFFEGYDKGQQDFHYNFKFGGLSSEMGWLAVSGEINAKKDGKACCFPDQYLGDHGENRRRMADRFDAFLHPHGRRRCESWGIRPLTHAKP